MIYSESKTRHLGRHGNFEVMGFTRLKIECDDGEFLFRAHPWYQGKPWHDWAFVKYAKEDKHGNDWFIHYPSLTLGFVQLPDDDEVSAVIRTCIKLLTGVLKYLRYLRTP